jgi:hypothetical protein
MKKIILLGAALSLASGMALADSVSGASSSSATGVYDGVTQVRAESGGQGDRGEWRRGKHHGKHHAKGGKAGPRHGFGPSRGAHIVLERNGNRIDVQCADGDSTQQCVEAVKSLMDQVTAKMDRGGRSGDSSPAPEGSPAPQP